MGLIGALGYELYTKPHLRRDTRLLATAGASGLVLLGAEGYLAEAYRKTAAGQAEERRAREEGAALIRRTKDIVLRPGVLGGIVGVGTSPCESGMHSFTNSSLSFVRSKRWYPRRCRLHLVCSLGPADLGQADCLCRHSRPYRSIHGRRVRTFFLVTSVTKTPQLTSYAYLLPLQVPR